MACVKVIVPATSANIGPGFDSLGLAISMYARFRFETTDAGLTIRGCPKQYQNARNMAATAFFSVYERLGLPKPGLILDIDSDIPPTRGLGSSSAMLTAGVMAANYLCRNPLSKADMLTILTGFEGHPDNVTPALYGGLTASAMNENTPVYVRYDVHPDIRLCALIPDFELSTVSARMALPTTVPHKDAVYNLSRVALLLKGLETNDKDALKVALHDRLHQPYREHLIDEYKTVRMLSMTAGAYGMYLSGAGPTLMAVYEDQTLPDMMRTYTKNLRNHWRVESLSVDRLGARIVEE